METLAHYRAHRAAEKAELEGTGHDGLAMGGLPAMAISASLRARGFLRRGETVFVALAVL